MYPAYFNICQILKLTLNGGLVFNTHALIVRGVIFQHDEYYFQIALMTMLIFVDTSNTLKHIMAY